MTPQPQNGKRLSTRLFAALVLMSLLVLLAAVSALVAVSWTIYEQDAEDVLVDQTRKCGTELSVLGEAQAISRLSTMVPADTRATLIAGDGTVLYDSSYDAQAMPNHGNREEVVAARFGKGAVTLRTSATTGTDTLYAAVLVGESDEVLRLSTTRPSIGRYLESLMTPLLIIMALAIVLSLVMARVITRMITAPLVAIDPEKPLESDTYAEISPLLTRIEAQKRKLVDQNAQLERAVALRREFTGNVSHEMKSPLQVISGYAELIENGIASQEDGRKFAGLIYAESQSMRRLIDDVLMLSRLDESVSAEARAFDLVAVSRRALDRLDSTAEARGIRIVLVAPDAVRVLGYETTAEQVVYNLIDNAIRHGREDGRVEVHISDPDPDVILAVSDDGEGIPVELRGRVFERFYRVDPSRSRETGGTGLGLAIVKHGVESMGGSVRVDDSRLGGAKFTVTLPGME